MKTNKKKSELTGLTRQTLDSCRESLTTKQKKKIDGLTRQTRLPVKPEIRVMKV